MLHTLEDNNNNNNYNKMQNENNQLSKPLIMNILTRSRFCRVRATYNHVVSKDSTWQPVEAHFALKFILLTN